MRDNTISQDHGSGAAPMRNLLDDLVVPRFGEGGDALVDVTDMDDGAVLPMGDTSIVVTTDSHVVDPLQFPGGDIGRLAVSGTVNDLAMMGATENVALTSSLIVEDGFDQSVLDEILASMAETCDEAGCRVVAGDTKVMGAGDVDGLVVNTAGVGMVDREAYVTDNGLSPGDRIVVSGTIGDHGIALLAAREDIDFEQTLVSDVAPVSDLVDVALTAGPVTAMKDPTRGGLATVLNEMAEKADVGIEVEDGAIPVREAVEGAGEILGINPYHVANEGKVVFGVPEGSATDFVEVLRGHPLGERASIVGTVVDDHQGDVVLDTGLGRRFLSEPISEPLPRIC